MKKIRLPDGTVITVDETKDLQPQIFTHLVNERKKTDPSEYDPTSPEYQRKYAPAAMEKTLIGVADPKTGLDLSRLPVDQRDRFFNDSARYLDAVGPTGKRYRDYTPSEQAKFWAEIDHSASPKYDTENVRAGLGSGMLRGWKGLTNLVAPHTLPGIIDKMRGGTGIPEWASDENIQEQDVRDQYLPTAPKVAGGVAATAPVSAPIGAVQRGATALSTASNAPRWLTGAVGSAPARATLEGAAQGAIFADPEEQGTGALLGGGLGWGLNRLGAVGGRLTRGAATKSPDALHIEHLAQQAGKKIDIPLAQAVDDKGVINGFLKVLYKHVLPSMPGVEFFISRQSKEAAEVLRELAVRESLPTGAALPAEAGKKVLSAVGVIDDEFKRAYGDTIKKYAFNVSPTMKDDVANYIISKQNPLEPVNSTTREKVAKLVDRLFSQFSSGKSSIDGANLLNIKGRISELMREAKRHEIPVWTMADDYIDDLVKRELSQGNVPSNLADLKKYLDLSPAWKAFVPLKTVAEKSARVEGRFKFGDLADEASRSAEQRTIGQVGHSTLGQSPTTGGLVGKAAMLTGLGGLGVATGMAGLGVTGPLIAGTNAMASKGFQRALLGNTRMQKLLAEYLRKHPEAARRVGSALRAGTVEEVTGSN